MKIERVRLQNFGPFYNEHEIAFPGDGSGVQVIRGNNGQGKTSIQRAILWALYGKVFDRKGQEVRPTSLVNRTASSRDIYQFGVILYFNHEGKKWSISRKMHARNNSDAKYYDGMNVAIVRDGEPQPNPEHVIQRILPIDVSRFFFFDGEMLRDYEELLDQSSHAMALLRDSIEHVLGIPYLRIARDDLSEVQRKIEIERARLLRRLGGKDYEELVSDFQTISEELDALNRQVKEIDRQLASLDTEIAEKKRRLADLESVRKLGEERLKLEGDIKYAESQRDREEEARKVLLAQFYKTVLAGCAEDVIAGLEQKHKAVMAKYDEKQQLIGQVAQIKQAINAQKCRLCGTVLNQTKLQELSSNLGEIEIHIKQLTEIPEPNLEFENHVTRLKQMVASAPGRNALNNVDAKVMKLDHEISAARAKVNAIREQLAGVDDTEPRELAVRVDSLMEEFGRLKGVRSELEKRILEELEIKGELDRRMARIDRKELTILATRIDFVSSVTKLLDTAVSAYRDERRADVEKAATAIFREIRTKDSFDHLSINNQFGLNIVTKQKAVLDRAEWRSAGEEQIVALSLVGALNRCAQVEAPVFMDTPFGRLDTKHGERVLRYLPKLADQVVLLVTDREFRPGDESILEGQVKSDHTVVYQGEREGSSITETEKE